MLSTTLIALAVALGAIEVYAFEATSPFIFYSTAHLDLPSVPHDNPTRDDVHRLLSAALSSCPTTHYLVVHQPYVSSSELGNESLMPFVSSLATSPAGLKLRDVAGQVSLDVGINTILMDCLHHEIKTVEKIDVFQEGLGVKHFTAQMLRENVIYAQFPATVNLTWHDVYLDEAVQKYFGGEDYTLLFLTQPRPQTQDEKDEENVIGGFEQGFEAEVPLVKVE